MTDQELFDSQERRITQLKEMNGAMESVLAKIGEHFNVVPGDVDGLLVAIEGTTDALEQATAKITTLEADRKKEWDARTVTENKLNERIKQLEAKLERCIWGGHPQPAQDRRDQPE